MVARQKRHYLLGTVNMPFNVGIGRIDVFDIFSLDFGHNKSVD